MRIETHRLTLIPQTLEHLRIELEEPGRLGVMLNARVPPGWPPGEYDRDAMEFFRSLLEGQMIGVADVYRADDLELGLTANGEFP